jgi:hypothetical protein
MLFFYMFACTEPRSANQNLPRSTSLPPAAMRPASLGTLCSFPADVCTRRCSPPAAIPLCTNLFRIITYKSDTKQTTLTIFRINTYENHRGRGELLLTKNPKKDFYPEEHRDRETTPGFNNSTCKRSNVQTCIDLSVFVSHFSELFHFPYPVSPVFATLTKTPGVYANSSHFGTLPLSIIPSQEAPFRT